MIFEPSGKLQRMLAWRDKLHADYAGTWWDYFRTKGYMKAMTIREALSARINAQIRIECGIQGNFMAHTKRLHKPDRIAAQKRVSYHYVIECKPMTV